MVKRVFGTLEQPFYLQMNQYGPGDQLEFIMTGKALRGFVDAGEMTIVFGKDGNRKKQYFQRADSDLYGPGLIFSSTLDPDADDVAAPKRGLEIAAQNAIDRIVLERGKRKLIIGTGPLADVVSAMRKCTDDLVSEWGLDPKIQAHLTRHAQATDMTGLVRAIQTSYPPALLDRGKQGRVNVHALIDAAGTVMQCSVPASYNDPKFDELACNKVRKFAFEPAQDAQGNPVASYWNTTVTYRLN